MDNPILTVVGFLVVLGPIILLHEVGHFIAGKLAGIRILEFGLGFPPRAKKLFEKGGTEYTLNWLPLGGFVRPLGEDPSDEETWNHPDSVQNAPPVKRLIFFAAGAGMNMLLAVLLFALTGLVGTPAVASEMVNITSVNADSPAEAAGIMPGDIVIEIAGEPIKLTEDMQRITVERAGESLPVTVLRDGEYVMVEVTPRENPPAGEGATGVSILPTPKLVIDEVFGMTPAEAAKLQPGDQILSINGVRVLVPSEVEEMLLENAGEEVTLLIVRDGEFMRPTLTPEDGTDPLGAALTFESETELVYQSIPEALIDGVRQTIDVILYIPRAISDAIQGLIPAETLRPVSPLGVSQLASDAIQMSVEQGAAYYVIQFAALISVAVGISNLLPLPALDGGRIVFVIVEMIRGKRIDPVREGTIHMAGFLFFMAMMVLLVIVDIIDPLSLLN